MPELLHPGVYVMEIPSGARPIEGVSTSTTAFIGVTDKGPVPGLPVAKLASGHPASRIAQPLLVTNFTEYTRHFGGYRLDSFMTYAVKAFFDNGGSRIYIVRVAAPAAQTAALPAAALGGFLHLQAANPGLWGNNIWIGIRNSSDDPSRNPFVHTTDHFRLQVLYGATSAEAQTVEIFDNLTLYDPNNPMAPTNARTVINTRSEWITLTDEVTNRPSNTLKLLSPPSSPPRPPVLQPVQLVNGSDGNNPDGSSAVTTIELIGAPAVDNTVTGTGLYALDRITDVNLICAPGHGDPDMINAGLDYCKNQRPLKDCFFIADVGTLDTPSARQDGAVPDINQLPDVRDLALGNTVAVVPNPASLDKSAGDYGAIYYPWVWADDPIGLGPNPRILLPPSGFMAGLYARIDNSRGVFKAPAGTEAGIAGALTMAVDVGDLDQDELNPVNVNVIRIVPASGIVSWGARTIGSDAAWRYIPVRRMAIFLRVSIYYGIQWAVFEPNDEPLWASLRLNIRAFMLTQFRAGAFQGSSPDDAFFVQCDSTTTTQQDIDNGVVNILVGFAPLKPAEFVVLKLSQIVNQPAQ